MSCYFMVDTYIDKHSESGLYEEYIKEVKPIVEEYGGEYIVRSENVSHLSEKRRPDRVIVIRFPSREKLEECFNSSKYKKIMGKRISTVDSMALIVEED